VKQEKVLERVYEARRLLEAWQQVRQNAGAAGVDQNLPSRLHTGNSQILMDWLSIEERLRSSRQGCNPAGESPAVPIARFGCVAIPQFMLGNRMIAAWCKRLSCSVICWSQGGSNQGV
jgi:hypothetical protein